MLNTFNDLETARQICGGIIREGVENRFPLIVSHRAAQVFLQKKGLPIPEDVLAWISGGVMSDKAVHDWDHHMGGPQMPLR